MRWQWSQHYKKLQNNHNSTLQNKLLRWLQIFNVITASHARQWKVADEWSGNDLIVENAPVQSDVCDHIDHYEISSTPWGYIDDLPSHIMKRLDDLERYFFFPEKVNLFVWKIYPLKAFEFPYQLEKSIILRLPLYIESL